ncbi:MAG: hypothetical protein AB7K24_11430 [Gemmataceae bacterium]
MLVDVASWLGPSGLLLLTALMLGFLGQFMLCTWLMVWRRFTLVRAACEFQALAAAGRFDELRVRAFETDSALARALRDGIALLPTGLHAARHAAYRQVALARGKLDFDLFTIAGTCVVVGWLLTITFALRATGPLFGLLFLMLFLLLLGAAGDLYSLLRSARTLPPELLARFVRLARRGDAEAALALARREHALLADALAAGLACEDPEEASRAVHQVTEAFLQRGLKLLHALIAIAIVAMLIAATALPFLLYMSGA